ncbi:hypothetical protein Lal_00023927 [Lupinus albus]|nr:hypothetical protein Lal_00023927 [Lupinus albus]
MLFMHYSNYLHRRSLWAELSSLRYVNPGPWCYIGDFNTVLGANECRGLIFLLECCVRISTILPMMRLLLTPLPEELSLLGLIEEWVMLILKKRLGSDNHPLFLSFSNNTFNTVVPFRFHKMWLQNADLKRMVELSWSTDFVGCHVFVLSKKLKLLKVMFRTWNVEVFDNVHLRVKNVLASVENIQARLNGLDQDLDHIEVNWHTQEDRNTKFFHQVAKIRISTKSLSMLRDGVDVLLDQDDIVNFALGYFI